MLDLRFTNQFKKDFKLAQKRGFDLSEFESIVNKLRNRDLLKKNIKIIHFQETGKITEIFIYTRI